MNAGTPGRGGVFDVSSPGLGAGESLPGKVKWCVIGSGPAGATVARALAKAGQEVVVLEEGPDRQGEPLTQRDGEMYDQLYMGRGGRTTSDLSMSVLGGRVLGGGSVINACDVVPIHRSVLRVWQKQFGLSEYSAEALAEDEQAALADLSVNRPDKSTLNRNNALLLSGCERLGFRSEIMQHNRVGCVGLGTCFLGCPASAKRNARTVQIPQAVADGVRFFVRARAKRIEPMGKKRHLVTVRALDERGYHETREFVIEAEQVILAAGAIPTGELLLRSGLAKGHAGRRFLLQPQLPIAAFFAEPVRCFSGIPQSVAVTEFENLEDATHGFWGFRIESIGGTPGIVSTMLPTVGPEGQTHMQRYAHLAGALLLHPDAPSDTSRLEVERNGRLLIHYTLSAEQKQRLRQSVDAAVRLFLAAGAQEVVVPMPPGLVFRELSDLPKLARLAFEPATVPLISAHQMGTARMGPSAKTAACSPSGELYDAPGVFVFDSSLFPSSPSSHIMAPVLTIAHHLSRRLLSRTV